MDLRMEPELGMDVLGEILRRVDAVTLAKASCVSRQMRRACEAEELWQRQCHRQWPATGEDAAHALIVRTGGYRQFCARCHPCVINSGQGSRPLAPRLLASPPSPGHKFPLSTSKVEDQCESSWELLPSHFVSIVDVMYKGRSMLSKVISGFPGTEEFEWFESCPFQFDLLEASYEVDGVLKEEEGVTLITLSTQMEPFSYSEERKVGSKWNALTSDITVSWILVNQMTGEMANIASSKAMGGLRLWPCEDECENVLHFGTIVPGLPSNSAVHCNVALKTKYSTTHGELRLCITELGMKLENLEGARLYGMESVAVLSWALRSSSRTVSSIAALKSYREFLAAQQAQRQAKVQAENQREIIAAFVSGMGAFICLCYLLL